MLCIKSKKKKFDLGARGCSVGHLTLLVTVQTRITVRFHSCANLPRLLYREEHSTLKLLQLDME